LAEGAQGGLLCGTGFSRGRHLFDL
jgi:hypothetical protein